MRIRHKVPSIFSLSMVDMLCCALGCVILVWLLNAKASEDEAEERKAETEAILSKAKTDREKSADLLSKAGKAYDEATEKTRTLQAALDKATDEIKSLRGRIGTLTSSEKTLQKDVLTAADQIKSLRGELVASNKRIESMSADLRNTTTTLEAEKKRALGLEGELKKSGTSVTRLTSDLNKMRIDWKAEREKAERLQKAIDEKLTLLAALEKKLDSTSTTRMMLEKTVTARDKELASLRLLKDRYEKVLEREKLLDKKVLELLASLSEANKMRSALEKEKISAVAKLTNEKALLERLSKLRLADISRLEKEKDLLRKELENHFAGITLTGENVIFLVDMSGSMVMLDQKTAAPGKWQEACRTVAQLMRSLPKLKKFQVIGFAPEVTFPLGQSGQWITHDPTRSPDQAMKALQAVTPNGGTNMYAALDKAFAYRAKGLDTIYVLSDGLPNQGEGVTQEERMKLSEVERGVLLAKHIRTTLLKKWNAKLPGQARVKINTIGFFFESPDLGSFLWALARENEGNFVGMSRP